MYLGDGRNKKHYTNWGIVLSYDCDDYDSLRYYFLFMNVKKPVRVNAIKIQNGSKNL